MHNMSICCTFSPARRGAMLLLRHVLRVLEGGINMQDQNTREYRLPKSIVGHAAELAH